MSSIFRNFMLFSMAVSAGMVLYFFFTSSLISPLPILGGLGFATIYALIVIKLLSKSHIWPSQLERRNHTFWIAAALLWGSGFTLLFALAAGNALTNLTDRLGWYNSASSWGGAYPEEIGKTVGVLVILMSFSFLNRPWHGLLVGAIIGAGFEIFENVLYGSAFATMHTDSDMAGFLEIWGQRVLAGPGLHIIFTGLAGWGIGWALFAAKKSTVWRWRTALSWLLLSFLLHFGWNYQANSEIVAIVKTLGIAAIMYPLFIWVFTRAHRLAKSDDSYASSQEVDTDLEPSTEPISD